MKRGFLGSLMLFLLIILIVKTEAQGVDDPLTITFLDDDTYNEYTMRVGVNDIYDVDDVKIYMKGTNEVPWIQIEILDKAPLASAYTQFTIPLTITKEIKVSLADGTESDTIEVTDVTYPENWDIDSDFTCEQTSDCPLTHICAFNKCLFQYFATQCSDTDDGIKPEVFGTCIDGRSGEESKDHCGTRISSGKDLSELFCDSNGNCQFEELDCQEGEVCSNGACIKEDEDQEEITGSLADISVNDITTSRDLVAGENIYLVAETSNIGQKSTDIDEQIIIQWLVDGEEIYYEKEKYYMVPASQNGLEPNFYAWWYDAEPGEHEIKFSISAPNLDENSKSNNEFTKTFIIRQSEVIDIEKVFLRETNEYEYGIYAKIKSPDLESLIISVALRNIGSGYDRHGDNDPAITRTKKKTEFKIDEIDGTVHLVNIRKDEFSKNGQINVVVKQLGEKDVYNSELVDLDIYYLVIPDPGGEPIDLSASEEYEEIKVIEEEFIVEKEVKLDCSGCTSENKCFPFGYRKNEMYCSENEIFTEQLLDNAVCENNFECNSNLCIDGSCVSSSLWQKFLSWLNRFFG